jgi:hypothetical protein
MSYRDFCLLAKRGHKCDNCLEDCWEQTIDFIDYDKEGLKETS